MGQMARLSTELARNYMPSALHQALATTSQYLMPSARLQWVLPALSFHGQDTGRSATQSSGVEGSLPPPLQQYCPPVLDKVWGRDVKAGLSSFSVMCETPPNRIAANFQRFVGQHVNMEFLRHERSAVAILRRNFTKRGSSP